MKASDTKILDFISGRNKVFLIPPFQRNYEWDTEQCDELFDDLVMAYKNNKVHYLGNIVYYFGQNSGASFQELILIDGQQRITTILLLLCAIRDITTDNGIKQDINCDYLTNRTQNEKYRIRLKQTAYDSDCFNNIISGNKIVIKNNAAQNYDHFKKRILESNIPVNELYNAIELFVIVDVNLQIENDLGKVQTVFEKINSTGKRLEPSDLIRNYLLLAGTINEQDTLYNEYWLKIEQRIKNENISKFAKDFLIINLFCDIPKEQIYKIFRKHFDSKGESHLNILKEMYRLSEYYQWLLEENCPNEKINLYIKYLNCLKTNDLYPLYLFLFDKLFGNNISELIKILNLLSDFMLRYRVVTPSGGGGALRAVIQSILELLSTNEIDISYDSILFELSNSANPSGRYPDDDEFKLSLMEHIDIPYARVALLKLEQFETKNIPVPIKEVTVEHLLPQTRTSWWINYLGGEKETDRIYDKYLNCIGNLAPISKGYNSKNSNKPWDEKLNNLKLVQFTITSEIKKYTQWKENDIINRNNDIATRLCQAITSPLPRTRKYQSKSKNNEINGVFALNDDDFSVTGTAIKYLIYKGVPTAVDTWRDLLLEISKILCELDLLKLQSLVKSNKIHKSTSKRNSEGKDPIFSVNPMEVITPLKISDTQIYIEGCLSAERARYYARQIAQEFGVIEDFAIEVTTTD